MVDSIVPSISIALLHILLVIEHFAPFYFYLDKLFLLLTHEAVVKIMVIVIAVETLFHLVNVIRGLIVPLIFVGKVLVIFHLLRMSPLLPLILQILILELFLFQEETDLSLQ